VSDHGVRPSTQPPAGTAIAVYPRERNLLYGIFGNISDADVRTAIEAEPELCAPRADVVWTRHRHEPD
jgi:hypothetical protein